MASYDGELGVLGGQRATLRVPEGDPPLARQGGGQEDGREADGTASPDRSATAVPPPCEVLSLIRPVTSRP
ncbi:hypothetical protein WKI71_35445 [Streptomyces sp. MS1.AVA.1]|uniref:Uncharacterized protein n=1 Tax=Streptomyces machairae TaxID=3134109 RepID=A0ABU8UTP2_9ACTN